MRKALKSAAECPNYIIYINDRHDNGGEGRESMMIECWQMILHALYSIYISIVTEHFFSSSPVAIQYLEQMWVQYSRNIKFSPNLIQTKSNQPKWQDRRPLLRTWDIRILRYDPQKVLCPSKSNLQHWSILHALLVKVSKYWQNCQKERAVTILGSLIFEKNMDFSQYLGYLLEIKEHIRISMTLTTFQWLVNRQYLSIFNTIEPSRQKNQSQSLSDRPNENVFYLFQYWSTTIVLYDTTPNNQHCQISRQIHRSQPTESRRTLIISFPITMIQWIKSSLFS